MSSYDHAVMYLYTCFGSEVCQAELGTWAARCICDQLAGTAVFTQSVYSHMQQGYLRTWLCVQAVISCPGALEVKILPRTAKLDGFAVKSGPPPEHDIPLDIPKRTALYVEQVTLPAAG